MLTWLQSALIRPISRRNVVLFQFACFAFFLHLVFLASFIFISKKPSVSMVLSKDVNLKANVRFVPLLKRNVDFSKKIESGVPSASTKNSKPSVKPKPEAKKPLQNQSIQTSSVQKKPIAKKVEKPKVVEQQKVEKKAEPVSNFHKNSQATSTLKTAAVISKKEEVKAEPKPIATPKKLEPKKPEPKKVQPKKDVKKTVPAKKPEPKKVEKPKVVEQQKVEKKAEPKKANPEPKKEQKVEKKVKEDVKKEDLSKSQKVNEKTETKLNDKTDELKEGESVDFGRDDKQIFEAYQNIQEQINDFWAPPEGVEDIVCEVRVFINKSGKLEKTLVTSSSGIRMYDISVKMALRKIKWPKYFHMRDIDLTFRL